jgi:flagellar biogenesis protein FliO
MIFSFLANVVFVPDEQGNLSAVNSSIEIPPLPQTGDYGLGLVKMFLTMIAIIVLFYVSYWFLRKLVRDRLQKGTAHHSIQILEKRMISAKTVLYLVQCDDKKILLAESQLEIKKIESFHLETVDHSEPNTTSQV